MLTPLGPDLWTLDFPFQVGALALGTRTTVVKLPDGGLWIHSPGPLNPGQVKEIEALGAPTALVSPNSMHHLFLDDASQRWPEAQVYATHALQRKKKTPNATLMGNETAWPTLQALAVGGSAKLGEMAFFHAPSKTLVLTDLAFNVRRSASSFTRFFMTVNGAYGHFGPSRLFRYLLVDQPTALKDSIQKILAWDFDKIVVGHGDVVLENGHDTFEKAFAYLF